MRVKGLSQGDLWLVVFSMGGIQLCMFYTMRFPSQAQNIQLQCDSFSSLPSHLIGKTRTAVESENYYFGETVLHPKPNHYIPASFQHPSFSYCGPVLLAMARLYCVIEEWPSVNILYSQFRAAFYFFMLHLKKSGKWLQAL